MRVLGPLQSLAAWVPTRDGIYFIEPALRISFFRFASAMAEHVTTMPKNSGIFGAGLALSPDGRWLVYGQRDRSTADLMLVENFR